MSKRINKKRFNSRISSFTLKCLRMLKTYGDLSYIEAIEKALRAAFAEGGIFRMLLPPEALKEIDRESDE